MLRLQPFTPTNVELEIDSFREAVTGPRNSEELAYYKKKKALSSDKPVYGFFQLHVSLPLLTSMSYPARHKLGNGNLYVPYSHT